MRNLENDKYSLIFVNSLEVITVVIKYCYIFVPECLHLVDVEGIPVSSPDKLPSFYQAICSLILHREVGII